GSIPVELGNLTDLQNLHLEFNKLSGIIPVELGNLTNLEILDFSVNQLNGSIPVELGNMTGLEFCRLSSNQLSGSIPEELGNLTKLHLLDLSSNQLSGSIPIKITSLSDLNSLDLSSNQLSGSIPGELSSLTNLSDLGLSSNQFNGFIPLELGNMTALTSLDLSNNQLSGSIPVELGNLIALDWLGLDYNQLTGDVPVELDNLTALRYLFLNNNHFNYSPDLSALSSTEIYIRENDLGFESLQNNWDIINNLYFDPQNKAPVLFEWENETHNDFILSVTVDGEGNSYQWYADGELLDGETSTSYSGHTSAGNVFQCEITNPTFPGFTISSVEFSLDCLFGNLEEAVVGRNHTSSTPTIFKFTAPEEGEVTISSVVGLSDSYKDLYLYRGCGEAPLAKDKNNDQTYLQVPLKKGENLFIEWKEVFDNDISFDWNLEFKARASLRLGNNSFTYNGKEQVVDYNFEAEGVTDAVEILFNGQTDLPVEAGEYEVTISITDLEHYLPESVSGTLTINPALLTVTVKDASKNYGKANPSFEGQYEGFVNGEHEGDGASLSGELSFSTLANKQSEVGTYLVESSGLSARNYAITFGEGTLTVIPAELSITANDYSREYEEENPIFEGEIEGLVNQDNITAAYSSTATIASVPGEYPITISLNDPEDKLKNYMVNLKEGVLVIEAILGSEEEQAFVLEVGPNPATSQLSVSWGESQGWKAKIYTLSGHLMLEQSGRGKDIQLDVSSLSIGVYILRLQIGEKELELRFVKQ
ncbi:MBG domain-containing protein, partial [Xanthovirga aplysinae]|uniref:MBG domain-containing protein n=1 Tax=Xanthovirga aplysinae TaxID=2529853 RepID=UPI0012BC943E